MVEDNKKEPRDLKWLVAIVGGSVAIVVGLTTVIKNWKDIFPPKKGPQAGLTVMVNPSKVDISADGQATVTWTLAETNNVGIQIANRTGEWRTTGEKVVKTVGPIQTHWRIEPFGRIEWTNDIVLYGDAANEALDGYLILDQAFQGQDDNGNNVIGKARVRVRLVP